MNVTPADPLDFANEIHERIKEKQIQAIRQKTKRELIANGHCHFCDEPVNHPKLFCNADCACDFEKLRRN